MAGRPWPTLRPLYRWCVAHTRQRPDFYQLQSRHRAASRRNRPGRRFGCECRRRGGARRATELGQTHRPRPGALSLCLGALGAAPRPPARGVGDARQWQADPRNPRYRYPPRRPAFLLPRWLGADCRTGISRSHSARSRRTDHPVEFSAADARLEDRPGAGDGQHGGAKTGGIYQPHGPAFRRAVPTGRPAARGGKYRQR